MKRPYSILKTNLIAATLISMIGCGGMQAMAQQDSGIPVLPGIEDVAPTGVPAISQGPSGEFLEENIVVEQIPVVVDEVSATAEVVATPSEEVLSAPKEIAENIAEPPAGALEALESTDADENLFYDANSLVPQGEFVKKGGTIKVNPRTQPASKFIVVRKNSSKNSLSAKLVAASRAIKLGRYDSALAIYDSLYKYNKRDPQILMGRALSLQHLGRIDESLTAYNDFLDRRPNDVNARVNMLGLMAQKYPAVSLRHLLELHEKHDGNVGIIAQIAVTYAQMGRTVDALKFFGMAAGMEPRNASHLFNMAIATDKAGDRDTAVMLYEKALETDAVNGSGSVPRSTIYERLAQLR